MTAGGIPPGERPPTGRSLRPVVRLSLLFLVALVAGGCWDRIEVSDLAIVHGMALDRAGPHSLELTISLAVPGRIVPPGSPGGGGAAAPPASTMAARGQTVMDALASLQEKLSRRLFWDHNAVVLIGDELAREGLEPVIQFFLRQHQTRLRTVVGIVPGRAQDVLAVLMPLQSLTPTALEDLQTLHIIVAASMLDFATALAAEGREAITARIEVVHSGATQPGMLETPSSGGQGGPTLQRDPPQPAITGAALFRGDRLVGYLDDVEARGVLWLRDEVDRATLTVTLGDPGRRVSFELVRSHATFTPQLNGERWVMHVKIASEHELAENAAGVDARDPEVISLLEKALAESIAEPIRNAYRRVQEEFRADVLGFGEAVRRADAHRWLDLKQRWDEVFPQVEVDLDVEAMIRRAGGSQKPLDETRRGLLDAEDLRDLLGGM